MAVKSRAQLKAYKDANRTSNGTNSNQGATENTMWEDVLDSLYVKADDPLGSSIYTADGSTGEDRDVTIGDYLLTFDGLRIFGSTHATYPNRVGVRTATPTGALTVRGIGTTDATTSFRAEDSGGGLLFSVLDNGDINGEFLKVDGGSGYLYAGAFSGAAPIAAGSLSNIGIGNSTLRYSSLPASGSYAIAIGSSSGQYTGIKSVYLGAFAGSYTDGTNNTICGHESGFGVLSTSTFHSTALFGYRSGYSLTTGIGNASFGASSGNNITTGDYNTSLGYNASSGTTTEDYTVSVGQRTSATADYACMLGTGTSGSNISNTLASSVAIGANSTTPSMWVIGNGAASNGGNVGIGLSAATARLHAKGADALSSSLGFKIEDSAGVSRFEIRNNGDIYTNSTQGIAFSGDPNGLTSMTFVNGILTATA